jgi:hypothetical protein
VLDDVDIGGIEPHARGNGLIPVVEPSEMTESYRRKSGRFGGVAGGVSLILLRATHGIMNCEAARLLACCARPHEGSALTRRPRSER